MTTVSTDLTHCTTIEEVRQLCRQWHAEGYRIGLVPTMGYLHDGHKSLIERASQECDRVIVSDFVNPTQFAPNEDLDTYPRDLQRDMSVILEGGGHAIFTPTPEIMYPDNTTTNVHMSVLSDTLCGKSRPIHFDGVCTVVTKLCNIVQPDMAFFGKKDAQQLLIIRRMIRDLNMPITIVGCPIVRENDGLAMSSRNTYLSPAERAAAPIIHRALLAGMSAIRNGETNAHVIRNTIMNILQAEPLADPEYVEVVDCETLHPIDDIANTPTLVACALHFGSTRLIDNFFSEDL